MATIFEKIASGEVPSCKVAESERYYAFLDINPLAPGHTLVIPRKATDYMFDLSDDDYAGLMLFAKRVAAALKRTYPCQRVGMAVVGFDVPHAHVHLVPMQDAQDIDFNRSRRKFTFGELQHITEGIADNFDS